ncbi:MAG: ABC transporter ATP-binding protein [bacterium]
MLHIENLTSGYSQIQVLQDLSFSVQEGEVLGLLGRNGAGKTTLLKTIMGLVRQTSGQVRLDQSNLSALEAHEIPRNGIGYVPQGRRLFPWLTVEENLKMGLLVRNSGNEVLEWVFSLFPVLRERLGQRAGTLSGGEQQMVATARALCLKPRYLLMDEPSEGLMPTMIATVFDTVERLRRENVGVLLVEQKIEGTLRVADRVLFLENGLLKAESTPDALAQDPALLSRYVGIQNTPAPGSSRR